MKKLLAILAASTLTTTGASASVACGVSLPPAISLDSISNKSFNPNVYMKTTSAKEQLVSYDDFKSELISLLSIALKLKSADTQQLYTQIAWPEFNVTPAANSGNLSDLHRSNNSVYNGDSVQVKFQAKNDVAIVKGESDNVTFKAHIGSDNLIQIDNNAALSGDNAKTMDIAQADALETVRDDLMSKFMKQNALIIRNATVDEFNLVLNDESNNALNDWTMNDLHNNEKIKAVLTCRADSKIVKIVTGNHQLDMNITVVNSTK